MENELNEDSNILGKKREREKELNYYTKEESYEYFEHNNKFIKSDIELIKSYSKHLFPRLKQSPIEIINVIVYPYTKFSTLTLEPYNTFLEKIKEIKSDHKTIIKYIYNNGTIHDEPITLPSDSNIIIKNPEVNNDNINNYNEINNNNPPEEINPYFIPLNSWEIGKSIKEYKWEGIIKIIILFGDNGFIKQVIKNIDHYHNNYLIINLNKITQKEKSHFNNIINDIYSFDDLISYLKQDIYEYSLGKNNIELISDKYKEYLDLLKRYINYDININKINDIKEPYYIFINLNNKNNIIINKDQWALFDPNSSSKSFLGQCFSSKIKKNLKNGIVNLLNPEYIINQINVEIAISNNIYNIININNNEENINFHMNDLTLRKKMVGSTMNIIDKNNYNQDYFLNKILLDYAICDYICDLFNIKLLQNEINLNIAEVCFYQCQNYNVPYFIAKEYIKSYKKKYNLEIYECFSHFSYCISQGKILIEDINEYDGKIFSFNLIKDNGDTGNEGKLKIFRFFCYHKCNKYCELLKLNNIDNNFFQLNTFNKKICDICKTIFDISKCNYDYNKNNICLCFDCDKNISESKYQRVCTKCGNKFEYYYLLYILQKKETPSICDKCKTIESTENKINVN